ncbi:putative membrane protein [Pseudomonas marginalis]|uniref:glycosyltransferase family 39 protein n=1 Tax=Pseudomonas marginalis TaxID=298 RepID=UPI00209FF656|nr:glycosyltransferase family 39 protein [Pseudomonas marginalis]MCP1505013.1 putative membrane protein [Pseudomonas marginalis]MCP1522517.1 putative membrane protein [Pseudomonas marginalis]MDQ0498165.1 mannosyltransferase [Pseudomonas marginalis]
MNRFEFYETGRLAGWLSIIALAAGVRFYAITDAYVWYDEAFSVGISALSPEAIWFHTGRDVHPPLYYLLLHGWMELFGKGPLAIRSLSAIAGILTVALGMVMARSIFNYRTAWVAGLFLALLPVSVRFSQEARMYALLGLFLMGATLALIYWMKKSECYRYCLIYIGCMTAALYTHYYAILAAMAHWLYLIVLRLHPAVRARHVTGTVWWTCNVLIAIAYIPWLFSLVDLLKNYSKIQAVGSVAWLSRASPYSLPDTVWRFFTLNSPKSFSMVGYWLVPVVLLVITGWIVSLDRTKYRFSILLMFFAFVPMLSLFVVSLFIPAYLVRYVAFSALVLPLILGAAVTYLSSRQVAATLLFFAVIGLELFGLQANYRQESDMSYVKSTEVVRMRQAIDYISAHRQAADIVVVGGGFLYFSAVFYMGSDRNMYLVDQSLDQHSSSRPNGYGATTLMYDTWDEHFLADPDRFPEGVRRVWWVTGRSSTDLYYPYQGKWREIDYLAAGELELRLYQAP